MRNQFGPRMWFRQCRRSMTTSRSCLASVDVSTVSISATNWCWVVLHHIIIVKLSFWLNCQYICMHSIYEEIVQTDIQTCPNAGDVSTVSLSVSRRCPFGLSPFCQVRAPLLRPDGNLHQIMFKTSFWYLTQCFLVMTNHLRPFSVAPDLPEGQEWDVWAVA